MLDSQEFVLGMRNSDKLTPVVTIVFYHGSKKYDGCRSLHDMLDLKGENRSFLPYIADYHMNLITLDRELIKNKEKYRESKGGNVNMCKAMEDWAEELKQEGKIEGKAEGKAEGILEGIKAVIEICKELGASREDAMTKIMEKFFFTKKEAGSYVEKYWQ